MEINKKNIHWFDLDGVLISTTAKWWIIDKQNPGKPLIKISQYEGALILSGFHRADNIYVSYNGHDGFMSKDMFLKIQKVKELDKKDVGFSWREFSDAKMIENQAKSVVINTVYIQHLKDTTDEINILTARGNKEAHKLLLSKLQDKLTELNVDVSNEYFVNDITVDKIVGSSARRKSLFILQNMVGLEIDVNKFVPINCEKYDVSYFYDDEDKNIEESLNMSLIFQELLEKTMPKLRDEILADIKERKPKLFVNLITSNEQNLFKTSEITL